MFKGRLVSFEGIDGSGKTTQSKLLKEYLETELAVKVELTREPGGTKNSEELRSLLLAKAEELDGYTKLLLFMAARREHIQKLIKPNLRKGNWVISDRYIDSTFAYQMALDKMSHSFIRRQHVDFQVDLWPDVTILLDIDPRQTERKKEDYYDNLSIIDKIAIRNAYWEIAQGNNRFIVINANQDVEQVYKEVIKSIKKLEILK